MSFSDTLPIPDQPLPDTWSGFLNSDGTDSNFFLEADSFNDSIVFDSQDSLETWAEQHFMLEIPASNEPPPFDSVAIPSEKMDTAIICYGMVSRYSLSLKFSISLSQTMPFVLSMLTCL
jgi:hypothetical protein